MSRSLSLRTLLVLFCVVVTMNTRLVSAFRAHAGFLKSVRVQRARSFPRLAMTQAGQLFSTEAGSAPVETVPVPAPVAPPAKPNNSTAAAAKVSELSMMEIRVGQIVEIAKHPEAESLYVEKVDVGEPTGPRTIVSGLVAFCKEEDLQNRKVIVLCNLKPRALKGILSQGMLLCASNSDHTQVVPLSPPADCPVGQLVAFDGHPAAIVEPGNKATKAFSKIADGFFVDDDSIATFNKIPFMTPQGPVTSTLKGKIS